eukprot:577097-Pyramimonas_sp.AAC.1
MGITSVCMIWAHERVGPCVRQEHLAPRSGSANQTASHVARCRGPALRCAALRCHRRLPLCRKLCQLATDPRFSCVVARSSPQAERLGSLGVPAATRYSTFIADDESSGIIGLFSNYYLQTT